MVSHQEPVYQIIWRAVKDNPELLSFWQDLNLRSEMEILFPHLDTLSPEGALQALSLLKDIEENRLTQDAAAQPYMPAYQIIRAFLDLTSSEKTDIKSFDIDTRKVELEEGLAGLAYYTKSGYYVVMVNSALEEYEQETLMFQELKRICDEQPRQLRMIGVHFISHLERQMDEFMEAIFQFYF